MFQILRDRSHLQRSLFAARICMCKWRSGENYPVKSELDLPSLTPLSVAGCDRLQLRAAHWVTSVSLLQVVDN